MGGSPVMRLPDYRRADGGVDAMKVEALDRVPELAEVLVARQRT